MCVYYIQHVNNAMDVFFQVWVLAESSRNTCISYDCTCMYIVYMFHKYMYLLKVFVHTYMKIRLLVIQGMFVLSDHW